MLVSSNRAKNYPELTEAFEEAIAFGFPFPIPRAPSIFTILFRTYGALKFHADMIKQEECSGITMSRDEPETVVASPLRHEEAKEVIGGSDGNHEHESHHNCIIDVKSNGKSIDDDSSDEKVCRICHLNSEHQSITSDLIHLGCCCKDELGTSHRDCAEIWFTHRGNRQCEICGQTATNVRGNRGTGFMIQRNERTLVASSTVSSVSLDNDDSLSCCWGQRFCNFLLTCTVLAFLLPWFFRLDFFG